LGKAPEGHKTQESNGPAVVSGVRAQARAPVRSSRERILGGSKAPKRAIRLQFGEPDVSGRSSGTYHGATRVLVLAISAFAGSPVPTTLSRRGPSRVCRAARSWRSVESDRDEPETSRRSRSRSNPQGSTKAAARRYGSSRGEGSEGRIPRALRHETRPQNSRASADTGVPGKPGSFASTRLNPPRG
jgi:hypothetical protein